MIITPPTMPPFELHLTYIGGPTALLELGGLRFLTDPTFDPAGTSYPTAAYTLRKTQPPAVAVPSLGALTAVLLSHDHHFDNLDRTGRALLQQVPAVYTTAAGAERLGAPAVGLEPWQSLTLPAPSGGSVRLTAVPARHGPPNGDRGPVIGFVLEPSTCPQAAIYVSGDTVWYEGVEAVGRFPIAVAILNLGAARVAAAGPHPLTFTAAEAVHLARAWPRARIVPLHFDGWEHFSEGRSEVDAAFAAAGLQDRLCWLPPGTPTAIPLPEQPP